MAFFASGQAVPDQQLVPRELIREETWGEIWRADLRGQSVLMVAWTTPQGDELFGEANAFLKRWKDLAGSTCPHLLRILQIHEGAMPYVICEDPGDMTLREYTASQKKGVTPLEQARWGKHTALGLHEATTYDVSPVGISPDSIFKNPADNENAWKLLPIGPGTSAVFEQLANGKYAPPELTLGEGDIRQLNPDSFSLAWLWAEIIRQDFDSALPARAHAIPYAALGYLLDNCFAPKGGSYGDPRMTALGVERWIKNDAEKDITGAREKEKLQNRGAIGNAAVGLASLAKRLAVPVLILGLIGAIAGVIYWKGDSLNPMKVTYTTKTPMGLATLYYQAMVARDPEAIKQYTNKDAAAQTFRMLKQISDLERDGWIDKFSSASPRVSGSGNSRSSEAMLFTVSEEAIGICQLQLQEQNGEWKITQVFFRALVQPVPGAIPPAQRTNGTQGGGGP